MGQVFTLTIYPQGKTSSKKSYSPEWKEVLSFGDMFPPLCNRIKVQLCDSDTLQDDVIATHFIELSQIMDPGGDSEGIFNYLNSVPLAKVYIQFKPLKHQSGNQVHPTVRSKESIKWLQSRVTEMLSFRWHVPTTVNWFNTSYKGIDVSNDCCSLYLFPVSLMVYIYICNSV